MSGTAGRTRCSLFLLAAVAASLFSGKRTSARSQIANTVGEMSAVDTPTSILRDYYRAINQHQYAHAYRDLALPGRLPYGAWAHGYRDTRHVVVDQINVPGYRIPENGSLYTCVGIHLTAHRVGGRTGTYGGWYLLAQTGPRWSMVLQGSRLAAEAKLKVPSWHACLSQVPPAAFLGLTAIDFSDVLHGWVAGVSLTQTYLRRTSDGGRSWQRSSLPAAAAQIDFVDARHGWALGLAPAGCLWDGRGLPCRQVLLATKDGGRRWRQDLRVAGRGATFPTLPTLQFIDRFHGWLIPGEVSSRLLATADGGKSWHSIFTTSLHLTSLHFVDLRHGWAAGSVSTAGGGPGCNTRVFATADGGRSWNRQLFRSLQCSADVDFVNAHDGWVLAQPEVNRYCAMGGCGGDFLSRTADAGRHWTSVGQVRTGSGFQGGVVFVTARVGWIPAEGGAGPGLGGINVTRDGGRTWTRYLQRYDVHGATNIALVNAQVGWLIGCSRGPTGTTCDTLWKTRDGGTTWRKTSW